MIKWKSYDENEGELIEFCCDKLKSIYGNLLTWDPQDKKWCLKVDRITTFQDPLTSKYIVKKVDGIEDLKAIDYCPFCGANCYKEEMRYDAWITDISGQVRGHTHTDQCTHSGWNTYICGKVF